MNRGIVAAISVIAIGSFLTLWGIVLYVLVEIGMWYTAILPALIIGLVGCGLINKMRYRPPRQPG